MLGWPWIKVYSVVGDSMQPTFKPGNILLASGLIKPKIGHVVVITRHPIGIKRIKDITNSGVWVEGDNYTGSTDSRAYGYLRFKAIKAVVFMKLL